ncbi:MAG: M16 family metallopeptidase, partial [Planctomycetia bacterium]
MTMERRRLVLPLESFRLSNGLRVFLLEDHAVPVVAVNVWYHCGSKDDDPACTGLAHLFEHLMFEGSARYDAEYFKPLQEAGGSVNGSTSNDRTNYYEVVPSHFLELALWMEADRMGGLLPVLSQAKLDNQRAVVQNERRQRVDNQPYGRVSELMGTMLYPDGHPYSWPIIGRMEHLDAASLDDVRGFFQAFYHPDNASLAVVGAFDRVEAVQWIEQYFGAIAPGKPRPPLDVAGHRRQAPPAPCRQDLEEAVALPRVDYAWRAAPRFHADEPALDFASMILGGRTKDSRFKRRLVYREKLASTVDCYHYGQQLSGVFGIRAYALPGVSLDAVEDSIRAEFRRFAAEPPTPDEMQRVRNSLHNQAYSRMETVLGRADALNHYLFSTGAATANSFLDELDAYERVTPADVIAAVERWTA